MLYTSPQNEKIKSLKKLKEKKYRDQMGLFLIEGNHLIKEAFSANLLKEIICLEGMEINMDVPIHHASKEVMKLLTDVESPSNIIGVCRKQKEKGYFGNILILDDIQDPGNLGAIIRSAVAFHVDTIVLSNQTVDLYNSKVIRASQGMLFQVNILRKELTSFLLELKEQGYFLYATQLINGKNIKKLEKKQKVAIIMGNEGKGVSKPLLTLSDEFIYINMNQACESLNVAVASSIILYELWGE